MGARGANLELRRQVGAPLWFSLTLPLKIGRIMLFYCTHRISCTTVYHHYVLLKLLSITKILIKLCPLSIDRASLILVLVSGTLVTAHYGL